MKPLVAALVAAGVRLGDADRVADRAFHRSHRIERAILAGAARHLEPTLHRLREMRREVWTTFDIHVASRPGVISRAAAGADADGDIPTVVAEQLAAHDETGTRLLALRRRVRDLEDMFRERLGELRGQPIADRLLRVLPADGVARDAAAIAAIVDEDHETLAQVDATWRAGTPARMVFVFKESTGALELRRGLSELRTRGHLVRTIGLRGRRWTRPDDAPKG